MCALLLINPVFLHFYDCHLPKKLTRRNHASFVRGPHNCWISLALHVGYLAIALPKYAISQSQVLSLFLISFDMKSLTLYCRIFFRIWAEHISSRIFFGTLRPLLGFTASLSCYTPNWNAASIGQERIMWRAPKLSNSLWRSKLTNFLGRQQIESCTYTWSGCAAHNHCIQSCGQKPSFNLWYCTYTLVNS